MFSYPKYKGYCPKVYTRFIVWVRTWFKPIVWTLGTVVFCALLYGFSLPNCGEAQDDGDKYVEANAQQSATPLPDSAVLASQPPFIQLPEPASARPVERTVERVIERSVPPARQLVIIEQRPGQANVRLKVDNHADYHGDVRNTSSANGSESWSRSESDSTSGK